MLFSLDIQTTCKLTAATLVNSQKGVGFDPSVIYPVAGDSIVFEFRSGQHSAVGESTTVKLLHAICLLGSCVESTFDQPCTPKQGGFDSGVQTVSCSKDILSKFVMLMKNGVLCRSMITSR